MHHIFINENEIDIQNKTIIIDKISDSENYNHLVKSLRLNENENVLCSVEPFISVFDYRSIVTHIDDEKIILNIVENVTSNELPVKINLYQGLTKSDKLEFIIEKSVELGVYSITPVETKYCIGKIDEKKIDKKLERYNKISKSAAEQSKRHIIPEVRELISFKKMLDNIANATDENSNLKAIKSFNLLFYENALGISETRKFIKEIVNEVNKNVNSGLKDCNRNIDYKVDNINSIEVNVIIGAEGGFSEEEIVLAREKGIAILSLGDRVLRTETASLTALSILMYELNL